MEGVMDGFTFYTSPEQAAEIRESAKVRGLTMRQFLVESAEAYADLGGEGRLVLLTESRRLGLRPGTLLARALSFYSAQGGADEDAKLLRERR
jgi:hypothetical protein